MLKTLMWLLVAALPLCGAERTISFADLKENQVPPGFRSTLTGEGSPGEWKIVLDDVPSAQTSFSTNASVTTRRPVVAQVARATTDEHYPLFVYEEETFGDFTLTTRIKTVAGEAERMAGIAFRIQDEKNYCLVRINSQNNTFWFYKFINGQRSMPVRAEAPLPSGIWHEISLECHGAKIQCRLNGKEVFPGPLTDNSFSAGRIGFWTKSDSVSHFSDLKLVYIPRESLARTIVKEALIKGKRVHYLRLYTIPEGKTEPRLIASGDNKEIGQPGGKDVADCIATGHLYYAKGISEVVVVMPLHDRNGDRVAAVRMTMDTFPGIMEKTAFARAMPLIRSMESELGRTTERLH